MGVTIQIRGRVSSPGTIPGTLGQRVVLGAVVLPSVATVGSGGIESIINLSTQLIRTQTIIISHHAFGE